MAAEVFNRDLLRGGISGVPVEEGKDAAAGAAGQNAVETFCGRLAAFGGEIGEDQKMILFRNHTGPCVVLGDRWVLVAQVHLDDFFDMRVEFGEAGIELIALRPDSPIDQAFLVVAQMHEAGKVLAQADGIEHGAAEFARGQAGEEPDQNLVKHGGHLRRAGFGAFHQEVASCGQFKRQGQPEFLRAEQGEFRA